MSSYGPFCLTLCCLTYPWSFILYCRPSYTLSAVSYLAVCLVLSCSSYTLSSVFCFQSYFVIFMLSCTFHTFFLGLEVCSSLPERRLLVLSLLTKLTPWPGKGEESSRSCSCVLLLLLPLCSCVLLLLWSNLSFVQRANIEDENTLNQLLSEMDGFKTGDHAVIVLGATNR